MKRPLLRQTSEVNKRGRPLYQLEDDFRIEFQIDGGFIAFLVPYGFRTDFASIPRVFWVIFPPTGLYDAPSGVHDFLYRRRSKVSRSFADACFRELMRLYGVPSWQRSVIYCAVRSVGWMAYKK